MFLRVDTGNIRPGAVFVGKGSMTTETKTTSAVNTQTNRIIGVIIVGTMTVFTTDCPVRRGLEVIIFILMTFYADFGGFVLDRIVFPLRLAGLAVPTVHVASLVCAKIGWD